MAKELEFCQSDFKCAVFNGSTLVTLYKDIRKEVAKGGIIIIDGNRCRISKEGEWCSNRIELEHDYPGNTNLDAIITFEGAKPPPRKIVKANPTPVPTSEIAAALAGLDDVYSYVNQLENNHKSTRDSTPKKPKQKQLSIKSPVLLNGTDYSTNLRLDVGERVMDDPGQFSGAPTLLSNPKERSMSSIRSLSALAAAVSTVPSQPLQSTPERHMLHELSQISENDRIERKQDMNKRLVEKGQANALARVEEYKRRLTEDIEGKTSPVAGSPGAQHRANELLPSYVEQQRLAALQRLKAKRAAEDEEILRKLKEEEEKQAEYKATMERKAEELRQKTAARVAELQRQKKAEKMAQKAKQEAELKEKLDRMNDEELVADRLHKIEQARLETEMRLKQSQDKRRAEQREREAQYEWRLKQLAVVNKRDVPTIAYIHTNNPAAGAAASKPISPQKASAVPKLPALGKITHAQGNGNAVFLRTKSENSHRSPLQKKSEGDGSSSARRHSDTGNRFTVDITSAAIDRKEAIKVLPPASHPRAAEKTVPALKPTGNDASSVNRVTSKPPKKSIVPYDDDEIDFENDSLTEVSSGVLRHAQRANVAPTDDIVMEYDDDIPRAKPSQSKKSVPSVSASRKPAPAAVLSVEKRLSGKDSSSSKGVSKAAHGLIPSADEDTPSDLSDDETRTKKSTKKGQASNDADTAVSSKASASKIPRRKQPKNPSWKLPPIPVQPYIAISSMN